MKRLTPLVALALTLTMLGGCGNEADQHSARGAPDRNEDLIPLSELRGDDHDDVDAAADDEVIDASDAAPSPPPIETEAAPDPEPVADTDADAAEPTGAPPAGDAETPAYIPPPKDQPPAKPRSIHVATWHPPDVPTPDWIHPAVRAVQGGRRMFGRYDGDYKRYTADVIREIRRTHTKGQPVVLILQHWLNRANFRDGDPSSIDPHGLFTHVGDRTEAGLPGIWPQAGLEFWWEANDYLFRSLKEAGITVDMVALDTEISPHGAAGPYSIDGTFEAIVNDPRWHTEPLLGFDGKTAADIMPDPPMDNFRLLWGAIRLIGQHIFAEATDLTLTDRVLAYHPDALVSEYGAYTRLRTEEIEVRQIHVDSLRIVTDGLGIDSWLQKGVGNTASPPYYGQRRYRWWAQTGIDEDDVSIIEAMLEHARILVDQYGADYVAPWIITRERLSNNARGEIITEEAYREWIKALVDLGIRRFLWFPGGRGDSPAEQRLTISAFEDAVRELDVNPDP